MPGPAVIGGILVALVGFVAALALAISGTGGSVSENGANGLTTVESAPVESSPVDGQLLVVDVSGAVAHPGVYRLPAGSRIADAVAAAGGYSPRVAADVVGRTVNLAALVQDGQLIVIPSRDDPGASTGSAGTGSGSGAAGAALIELNSATAEQLDSLPGIGPVTAAKIIAARAQAPFRSVDDLLTRKLVSQKTFDQLKSLVTVR